MCVYIVGVYIHSVCVELSQSSKKGQHYTLLILLRWSLYTATNVVYTPLHTKKHSRRYLLVDDVILHITQEIPPNNHQNITQKYCHATVHHTNVLPNAETILHSSIRTSDDRGMPISDLLEDLKTFSEDTGLLRSWIYSDQWDGKYQ